MKFITNIPKIHKLASSLKVGFEFTFTNADYDADYLYGTPLDNYYQRRNKCMNEMEASIQAIANHMRSINQCSKAFAEYVSTHTIVHHDPGVIEISAPPTISTRTNALIYDVCHTIAEKYGFAPYRGQECGGMHANVDTRPLGKQRYTKPFEQTTTAKILAAKIEKIQALRERSYDYSDKIWERFHTYMENTRPIILRNSELYEKILDKTEAHAQRYRRMRLRLNDAIDKLAEQRREAKQAYEAKYQANQQWQHGAAIAYMLNAFPSIVWTFQAPNDDESALIAHSYNTYIANKNCAARNEPRYEKYVEYRCVGMVGNSDQVKLVHRFFQRFSAWAHDNANQITANRYDAHAVLKTCVHTKARLHKFNLKKATRQFYHVCRLLELDPSDYSWWLHNHLAIRFTYDPIYHKLFTQ